VKYIHFFQTKLSKRRAQVTFQKPFESPFHFSKFAREIKYTYVSSNMKKKIPCSEINRIIFIKRKKKNCTADPLMAFENSNVIQKQIGYPA